MNIVLMGGPGSGKGSMAEMITAKYPLVHVATGDLFRKNLSENTELGQKAKAYIEKGQLVPDDITYEILADGMAQVGDDEGILLDGFPRNMEQAKKLNEIFADLNREISFVLFVDLDDETIIRRTSQRRVCNDCGASYHLEFRPPSKEGVCDRCGGEVIQRKDDQPETVKARLETYHKETSPVVDYYKEKGLLRVLDNRGTLEESQAKLEEILQEEA